MRMWTLLLGLLMALAFPVLSFGQGVIVVPPDVIIIHPPHPPRPPMPRPIPPMPPMPIRDMFATKSVTVDASVKDQVAEVQLAQVFRNTTSRQVEATFIFPVPPDAVISQFTLFVDGKEMPAKMYTKEEARRIYESIVRSQRDPALLEYVGYGALQTSVFPLPPNGESKVTLRYSQICRRDRDMTELLLPLAAAKHSGKALEELRITVRVDNPGRIKSVYSPTYSVNIERPSDHSAIVRYTANQVVPTEDFRLMWNLSDKTVGATVLSFKPRENEDGYFLLLASPEVKQAGSPVLAKTVVFVLDRSGSMAGQKIEQAKNALKFVLNNLREGDTFNIIAYDDRVETFKPESQRYTAETRAEAMRFIDGIYDGGSTNIDGALKRAMELSGNPGRPSYIIFLTDGLPTAGQTNEGIIAENAKNANKAHVRLFAFGVGFDVNARLLERLTTENGGTSEYVRPSENIEGAVAKFYGKMTAPVLTQIKMSLGETQVSRVYPRDIPDLFAGGQVLVVGRYKAPAGGTVRLTGRVGDREDTFEFPANLVARSGDDSYAFIEKLWASRRIGEIINELDLKGRNQELLDELVRLSTQHGILTPYTAFLADERTNLHAKADNFRRAEENVFVDKDGLANAQTGQAAVEQRAFKQNLQAAPQAAVAGKYRDMAGREKKAESVQVVGNQAMYRRDNQWVDPSVTAEEMKTAERVEQFSDRYFELARNNTRLRQFLALPDGCTVRVDGRVYQVVPQQNRGG